MHNIIRETCDAIWDALSTEMIKMPTTTDQWQVLADDFNELWNFPNCIGAIDGKHVVIQAPPGSGSEFYNYKGTFSVVLLAMCDAKYCFTMVDIGAPGKDSDGGVFSQSLFGKLFESGKLQLPSPAKLPQSDILAPYVIVADAAFPLRINMLKPYPGKKLPRIRNVFNYRLSRARRVIENTFGILANRWRIFRRVISAKPENACRIIKAACVLHNYLQRKDNTSDSAQRLYCPTGYVDSYDSEGQLVRGQWRLDATDNVPSLTQLSGNRTSRMAAEVRDEFANYFVSNVGEVEWQYRHVENVGPQLG